MVLSENDFSRLMRYVKQNYGIDLRNKKELIVGRLSGEIARKGFRDFHEYVDRIIGNHNQADAEEMLNYLTTNYTYFMREPEHFKYFQNVVLPNLVEKHKKDKVLSIWSAGCSSGQEPYTLSMILKDYFSKKGEDWDTRILATDISKKILTKAQEGIYKEGGIRDLPEEWKQKYFEKNKNDDTYTISKEIRDNVIFKEFNLMSEINFKRKMDVIFCRNVMIYFDKGTQGELIGRLNQATNPGGYLFIGHSENITLTGTDYQHVISAGFRKL